jgi:hypothetical protein
MAKIEIQHPSRTLPEGYYLANFERVLEFIKSTYHDVLHKRDLEFLKRFESISDNARLLFLRLALRSKNLFCQSKLNYSEIDIDGAVKELEEAKLLELNSPLFFEDYSAIFTIKELQFLGRKIGIGPVKGRRAEVIEALAPYDEQLFEQVTEDYKLLLVLESEVIDKFIFLFFGNAHEDMSHFILEDLGVRRYQKIEIDKSTRLFKSKLHIKVSIELSTLHAQLWLACDEKNEELVTSILETMTSLRCPAVLKQKRSRSLNLGAHFFEKKRYWDKALEFYGKSTTAPARERCARIQDKKGNYKEALALCEMIIKKPYNSQEQLFAEKFKEGLKRKLGLAYEKRRKNPKLKETVLPIKWNPQGRVEQQVLDHLMSLETGRIKGFFCENAYWCALCALLFWEEYWTPGDGVFLHPFEGAARDFYSGGFFIRQEKAIEEKLRYWQQQEDYSQKILSLLRQKRDIYCDLVQWKRLDLGSFELLLKHTPIDICLQISLQILKNPREFRSGLPDLFLVGSEGFILAEVKSPNDQIQKSQKRWFDFFSEKEIPYLIYRVKD